MQSISMDGVGKVYAVITDVSADVKKKVAEKKLKYMSVEIYEHDKADENQPHYLRAISLLGRDTPAVAVAKLSAYFSLAPGGRVCFAKDEEHTTVVTGMVDAAANEKIAAFKKQNESLYKTGAETFFSKLRDEGKLPPALFEKVTALDAKLGEVERAELRAVFSAMEITADLSGNHAALKAKAPKGGDGSSAVGVTAKIHAFQKKGFASFSDAAEAFYVANPAAFDDEGGNE